jgi:hypothetical protein
LRPENIVHQTMKMSRSTAAPASNISIHITVPYVFDLPKCTCPPPCRAIFDDRADGRLHDGAAAAFAPAEATA